MERNDAIALRILSTAVTVLLLASAWVAHGSFGLNVLLGMATGLSIGVQAIVWQKQLHWIDRKIYPAPAELHLGNAGQGR